VSRIKRWYEEGSMPPNFSHKITVMSAIYKLPPNVKNREKIVDGYAKCSIALLHIIEKRFGWALTRIYKIDPSVSRNTESYGHVYTSSIKWRRSSQLLSLYTLLMRCGRITILRKAKSFDDLDNILANTANKIERFSEGKIKIHPVSNGHKNDIKYLLSLWSYIDIISKNMNKLFFNRSAKTNLLLSEGYFGINGMISGRDCDKHTTKMWKHICREVK
jgi:hypothetical protein